MKKFSVTETMPTIHGSATMLRSVNTESSLAEKLDENSESFGRILEDEGGKRLRYSLEKVSMSPVDEESIKIEGNSNVFE